MGLFNRNKKKQNPEKNEIENKELKERLADAALQLLTAGEDYEQLIRTTCDFGYLFVIEGHGLEALFKITTDKGIFYFAAQKSSIMRLSINEDMFQDTTQVFLDLHK